MKMNAKITFNLLTTLYLMNCSVMAMDVDHKGDDDERGVNVPVRLSKFIRVPAPEDFNKASIKWKTYDERHRSPNPEIADHFVNKLTAAISLAVDGITWVGEWSYIDSRAVFPLDPYGDYKKVLQPFARANPPTKVQVNAKGTIFSCVYKCVGMNVPSPFKTFDHNLELRFGTSASVTVKQVVKDGVPGFEVQDSAVAVLAAAAPSPAGASSAPLSKVEGARVNLGPVKAKSMPGDKRRARLRAQAKASAKGQSPKS